MMTTTATPSSSTSSSSSSSSNDKGRLQSIVMILLFASTGLFYWSANQAQTQTATAAVVEVKKIPVPKRNDEADHRCSLLCQERRKLRYETNNGIDILDIKQVLHAVTGAKARYVTKLKIDYGEEYFTKIFVDPNPTSKKDSGGNSSSSSEVRYRGIEPLTPSTGESVSKLHRKILMKLLMAQTKLRNQESNLDGCDCINGDRGMGGIPTTPTTNYLSIDSNYGQFIWTTGGHSAAAGHGNLYNETYTAFLETGVKDIFASMGIHFIGRNYAMGGTSSGFEISMCSDAIFGTESDLLSWDFGMTDGNALLKLLHYFYRASLTPGRPILLGVGFEGRYGNERFNRLKDLEDMGMSTFWIPKEVNALMNNAIPETSGMSEDAIKSMPEFVRNFKCAGVIEKGDPYCGIEKYNQICIKRKGMASWHPGVKAHALDGNRMGLFLAQMVTDTLKEYVQRESSHPNKKPEDLLAELLAEEDLMYKEFKMAPLPEIVNNLKIERNNEVIPEDVDVETFFRGPNICHTGRTPSRTRYLGILTDTDKVGEVMPAGHETYDVGMPFDEAIKSDVKGEMQLVYQPNERDHQNCKVPIKIDYKDFFFAHGSDGWVKLVLPNKSEKAYFNYDPAIMKGIVVIFFGGCEWGKCKPGDLQIGEFQAGEFEFEVNGKPVTTLSRIGGSAGGFMLKGENGVKWPLNSEGQIELRTHVKNPTGYVRLSSIVLY